MTFRDLITAIKPQAEADRNAGPSPSRPSAPPEAEPKGEYTARQVLAERPRRCAFAHAREASDDRSRDRAVAHLKEHGVFSGLALAPSPPPYACRIGAARLSLVAWRALRGSGGALSPHLTGSVIIGRSGGSRTRAASCARRFRVVWLGRAAGVSCQSESWKQ